jgi:zinc/manganese transport system substrate-binding protein
MRCRRIVAAVVASAAALVGACTDDSHPEPRRPTVTVVASNNVYAALVEAVGGSRVRTTSLITSTTESPHRYVPSSAAAAVVASADLLVGNGGSHDDWLAPLMRAAERRPVTLLAEDLRAPAFESGRDDHYWYDLPSVAAVVDAVVVDLTRISPQQAETFTTNAAALRGELQALRAAISVTRRQHLGARVCLGDPHALRLVKAMGLRTTGAPLHAGGAESAELSPTAARTIQRCVESPVRAVLLDPADETVAAEAMRAAALDAGIPIVDAPEVMPDDAETYPLWLGYQIDALAGALADTS